MDYFGLDSYVIAEGSRHPVNSLFLEDFGLQTATSFTRATTDIVENIVSTAYLKTNKTGPIMNSIEDLKITNPSSILIFISKQKQMTLLEMALKASNVIKQAKIEIIPVNSVNIEKDNMLIARADNDVPKIYISTNVIETGYTINNVSFVVDCMKFKSLHRNPISKVEFIRELPIDKQM
jgi:HrpA-like RNA helicase